jgi:hypothetical protein
MTTELVKTETNSIVAAQPQTQGQEILNSDIVIPKLLLMQGLSEFVVEKKKCPISGQKIDTGNFVRSTTMEIVGSEEAPVRFIPLKMVSNWILQESINGKFEYRKLEPRTAKNEMEPWEFQQNGTTWRRVKTLDVFALLEKDIASYQAEMANLKDDALPDLNKMLLPVVISFRSTSFNAGKGVATFFAQIRDLQRYKPEIKSYGYSLELGAYQDKNDKGSYYVFKVGASKKVPDSMVVEAERWYQTLMHLPTNIKVDEAAEEGAPTQTEMQF